MEKYLFQRKETFVCLFVCSCVCLFVSYQNRESNGKTVIRVEFSSLFLMGL